jgi:hypothetical protein
MFMKTKSDGLLYQGWVLQLLDEAKKCGWLLDTEANGRQILDFYNSDYSPEDAWQEIFEESASF